MKKRHIYKLLCLTCAGISWLISARNVSAIGFPTWDAGEVVNTINGYTTEVQSFSSTVQSTLSIGAVQQAVGDAVGGMEKFQNAKEKLEKEKEKAEKEARAVERKQKLLEKQMAEQMAELQAVKDTVGGAIAETKAVYETTKDIYDEGMSYVEEGKELYESGKEAMEMGKEILGKEIQDTSEGEESGLQNPDVAGVVTDATVSEDRLDGTNLGEFTGMEELSVKDAGVVSADVKEMNAAQLSQKDAEVSFADKEVVAEPADIRLPANKEILTRKQFSQPKDEQGAITVKNGAVAEKKVTNENVAGSSLTADKNIKAEEVKAVDQKTIKTEAVETTKTIQQDAKIRRKTFTTSEKNAFYQITTQGAFAQLGNVRSGYTDLDKFVFSDEMALACGMDVSDVSEEKVSECIKTLVMGMTDPNAVVAAGWKKKFQTILHDHVSQDLAGSLMQKSYAAAFQTEVAEDMEKKAEATSSERDQISYNGKVAQTSQEIIIRLMEAMTSQLVTDSLQTVGRLDRSYYEQDSE